MLATLSSVTANWQTPTREETAPLGAAEAMLKPRARQFAPIPTAATLTIARAA